MSRKPELEQLHSGARASPVVASSAALSGEWLLEQLPVAAGAAVRLPVGGRLPVVPVPQRGVQKSD